MGILFVWLLFSGLVAMVAVEKGHSGLSWFFVSALISPLLAILFLLMSGPGPETHVKCHICKEMIHKEALRCPKCTEVTLLGQQKANECGGGTKEEELEVPARTWGDWAGDE